MFGVKLLPAAVSLTLLAILPPPATAQTQCQGPYGPVACSNDAGSVLYAGGYRRQPYYPPYRQPRYVAPPRTYPYQPDYQPEYQRGYQQGYDNNAYQPQYEPDLIVRIQTGLDYLGYNPGLVDGVFGGRTSQAIREFQEDAGLLADGLPSDEFYASLKQYLSEAQ